MVSSLSFGEGVDEWSPAPRVDLGDRFEPALRDLGLQGVTVGPGVAVPQLREVEPNYVEPLRLLLMSVPRLILGRQALVRDDRDLALRAAHVFRSAGIEQGGQLPHQHRVTDPELRPGGLAGKHLRVALAERVRVVEVARDPGT